jgi:acetylornithine deacetylase/succinyl-diaminopimelate desuccinylase-like protein
VITGGGSDGNRTVEIIPTLDGLRAVGSTMHSPDEYLKVSGLRERAALLALFMETWYERF